MLCIKAKVRFFYIKSLFLLVGLAVEHDMVEASGVGEPAVLFSLVIILLIIAFAVYTLRRFRVASFGIFWFFIALLPETILPLNLIVNEHRVYLAGVGFAFIAGVVSKGLRSKVVLGLIVLFISLNAYGTIKRDKVWRDVRLGQMIFSSFLNFCQ